MIQVKVDWVFSIWIANPNPIEVIKINRQKIELKNKSWYSRMKMTNLVAYG